MIGSFAVGKTSLVARFVKSIFSEKYLTTVGAKIDKKTVQLGNQELTLILWDLHGDDEFQKVRTSYLHGSAGYLLVVDGTRRATLDKALLLQKEVEDALGKVPFVLALNKFDLAHEWEVSDITVNSLEGRGWIVTRTSAKDGHGVEDAFQSLAGKLLEG